MVAHEIGHHVSNLEGLWALLLLDIVTKKQLELQADCFAGAWLADAAISGRLEQGDLQEIGNVLFAFGDDNLGLPWFNPDGHGRAIERQAAFVVGFVTGPLACDINQFPRASIVEDNTG